MLAGTLSGQLPFVFALDSAEEAVAMNLAQVKDQGVQLGVIGLNYCVQLGKRKLNVLFSVENFFYQPRAEGDVPWDVAQRQLGSDTGLPNSLIVFHWAQLEVLRAAVSRGPNHERLEVGDGGRCLFVSAVDQPGEALEIVHLQRPTQDDLLQPLRH